MIDAKEANLKCKSHQKEIFDNQMNELSDEVYSKISVSSEYAEFALHHYSLHDRSVVNEFGKKLMSQGYTVKLDQSNCFRGTLISIFW